jgi:hypothetical protein
MSTATGTFEVRSADETAYHEAEGEVRLTHASGTQRFSGDIEGDGSVEWLMCYLPIGGARMVGMQRIVGTIGGRKGTLMIDAVGDHDGKGSTATLHVVDGSGTDDLTGIRGHGSFEARGGSTVTYHLEYEIDKTL